MKNKLLNSFFIIVCLTHIAFSAHTQSLDSLFLACSNGNKEQVIQLLTKENVNSVDTNGQTPLHFAVCNVQKTMHYEYWAIIEILLENGADPNLPNKYEKPNTPLTIAKARIDAPIHRENKFFYQISVKTLEAYQKKRKTKH